MTNHKLLLDANWQAKKDKIIIRDGFKCVECKNFNLIQNSVAGLMFYHGENYQGKLFGFYGYNKAGVLINHKVFIKRYLNIIPLNCPNGHVAYIDETSENETFAKIIAIRNREITDYEELVLTHPSKLTVKHIHKLKTVEEKNYCWKVTPSLVVRHSYYSKALSFYEYPDNSLQTMCRTCLEQLNEKQGVPYLNENGDHIRTITPCKKCLGTGYFPSTQEQEETICDRCKGVMYEEFFYTGDTRVTASK